MPKKDSVTLDDLATMVVNGFHDVSNEISGVKTELKEVKQKLHEHDKEFSAIRFQLTELATKNEVHLLEERVDRVEKKLEIA